MGEVLAMFDISVKADVALVELSKSMRQRLPIARMLVYEPELLFEERNEGLDPHSRRSGRDVLREVLAREE